MYLHPNPTSSLFVLPAGTLVCIWLKCSCRGVNRVGWQVADTPLLGGLEAAAQGSCDGRLREQWRCRWERREPSQPPGGRMGRCPHTGAARGCFDPLPLPGAAGS